MVQRGLRLFPRGGCGWLWTLPGNAAAKAKEAAGSFQELNDQLKSTSALLATENTKSLAESISKNSEFARIVSKSLAGTLEFTILKSDFIVQQATKSCPAGSQIVSASCIGNNGSLQAAVGPEFHLDGSVTCYRCGPTVMPVQATVICMTTK